MKLNLKNNKNFDKKYNIISISIVARWWMAYKKLKNRAIIK